MPDEPQYGEVITFYSYKGGTGRSMALANVACVLAQAGKRVLIVDWDLEAPGLHHFLPPADGDGTPADALLELFYALRSRAAEVKTREDALRLLNEVPLRKYVSPTDVPGLDLLPAGRFDATYGARVNAFSWEDFFNAAPPLLPAFAEFLSALYDYVLVDSRTGITDVSGICTTVLPSKLVVVFTPNKQSLTGIFELVRRATKYRRESNDWRPLAIFPLPSRIEPAREQLMKEWRFGTDGRPGYQKEFESLFREVYQIEECDLTEYLNEVQIQHVADYAYGEQVAVLIETASRLSLKRSYEEFASRLQLVESAWQDVAIVRAAREIETKLEEVELVIAERRFTDAWSMLRGILELYHRQKEVEVAELPDVLSRTGAALLEEGKPKEALEMLNGSVEAEIRESGPNAPETAMRLLALAHGSAAAGLVNAALTAAERAVWILSNGSHAGLGEALQLVGEMHARMGDFDRSLEAHTAALAAMVGAFGERSEQVAQQSLHLARQTAVAGDHDAADDLLHRALEIYKESGSPEKTVNVMREAARLSVLGGDLDGAQFMLHEVLRKQRELLGPRAPELAETLDELARIAVQKEDFTKARALLEDVYFRLSTTRDRADPTVIDTLSRIGYMALRQGDLEVAHERLESAMAIADSALPNEHPLQAVTRLNLAELLVEKGQFAEAEAVARQALTLLAPVQGARTRATALTVLANALRHQGKPEEARAGLEEARGLLPENDAQLEVINAELSKLG